MSYPALVASSWQASALRRRRSNPKSTEELINDKAQRPFLYRNTSVRTSAVTAIIIGEPSTNGNKIHVSGTRKLSEILIHTIHGATVSSCYALVALVHKAYFWSKVSLPVHLRRPSLQTCQSGIRGHSVAKDGMSCGGRRVSVRSEVGELIAGPKTEKPANWHRLSLVDSLQAGRM